MVIEKQKMQQLVNRLLVSVFLYQHCILRL